jgi:putative hydrolase of the HAD superfamily
MRMAKERKTRRHSVKKPVKTRPLSGVTPRCFVRDSAAATPERLAGIKGVIFDMGNTIYDKKVYIDGAFQEIIRHLSRTYYLNYRNTLSLFRRIWKVKTAHYEFLLDNLLTVLGLHSPQLMEFLLNVYYHHKSKIKPYPGVVRMLDALKKRYKLAILTDGNPVMQRNKIWMLGIEDKFDVIVYTAEYPEKCLKPDPFCYRMVIDKLGVKFSEVVYVADNPCEDFVGAKQMGILTIRVKQGEFKDTVLSKDCEADITVNKVTSLTRVLRAGH